MKPLTKDQQIENCLLALMLWAEVKISDVNINARIYGSVGDLGAFLVTWPEFQAKGVFANWEGTPRMKEFSLSYTVAEHLFGSALMFIGPSVKRRAHREIIDRLENQIARLSEAA